ncbi:EamA family transporter RarD [Leucobacter sp. Z1108]|uniref:EamA family transporter RarD n=1 Tax=Leucobacter sp. Z1108 TaxID=3439066 RepID=UPI003F34D65F
MNTTQNHRDGAPVVAGTTGIVVSVASSLTFSVLYFLTPLLAPLPAEAIWAMRSLIAVPIITGVLWFTRGWWQTVEIGRRIRREPWLLPGIMLAGGLLALQVWIFGWAPLNGSAMQVALGYFLLPLVLVLVGRFLYGDRMVWWQWIAAAVAATGVVFEIVRVGGISWETLVVALGYPVYFVLRRGLKFSSVGGIWWELVAMAPLALVVLVLELSTGSAASVNPMLWWAAPIFGVVAGFAQLFYLLASRLLSMSIFGLLSYLEPALLVVAAVLIGERIAPGEWFTYGAIWTAVLILVVGGVVGLARSKRRRPGEPPPTTQPIPLA